MLVITRRKGERLLVGAVEVVVLEIRRGRVRLGFEAHGAPVVRLELVDPAAAPPRRPRVNARR